MDFKEIDRMISRVEASIEDTQKFDKKEELLLGVDLGTAYVVLLVLDKSGDAVACEIEEAEVVRDGLVLDYMGALNIVTRLKKKLENRLGAPLNKASIAIPPRTSLADTKTHKYVVEGAGLDVINILDEPTAANSVLKIKNGAIIDIGGGTTGISVFEKGQVIYTNDEATGGLHMSLVISGNFKLSLEEGEKLKRDRKKQREILPVISPVIQKISTIIKKHINDYNVEKLYLVGGSSCFYGIEKVIEEETRISTIKPSNPFLVTPLGIAMNCFE